MIRARLLAAGLLLAGAAASGGDYSLYEQARLVARPDYSLGVVFIERWRGDYYLGVERVISVEDYLEYQLTQSVAESWVEKAERTQRQRELAAEPAGLIPDIELPKLPIFGEGSKIDISGQDKITLGGRQTSIEYQDAPAPTGNLFPELKMEQLLRVALNGTIGERTRVNIDFDQERLDEKNKVVVSYTGTEDEILQSLELGDTRLSIPGSIYTGDLPAHHGLFGATAKGKLGAVDLYAVASREQSQSQTQTFSGRRTVATDTIYGGRYVGNRFYLIPTPDSIRRLEVYVDDKQVGNNEATIRGIATVWVDYPDSLPNPETQWTYDRTGGEFDMKKYGRDYIVQPGNILEFAFPLDDNDVVGLVIYTNHDTIGGQRFGDSLVLSLLKPELPDRRSLTWDFEQRNVYSLRSAKVTLESLWIFYKDPQVDPDPYRSSAGTRYTQLLGLDPNDDGKVEYPQFDGASGLVRFTGFARPFASTLLEVKDSSIYEKKQSEFVGDEGTRYYLVAKYSSSIGSYYLGQPDITEGSEKVVVNGQQWTSGVDYTVNARTGTVTFIRALPPDADIRISYEYRPLFSLTQKSLVGARAEWVPSGRARLGSSIFFRDEGMREDKPALGSEPFRRVIAEADASYSTSSDAVTAFLDRLPLLRAQAPTTLSAAAEGAISLPDPNTRGIVYLDDFESTTLTRDVSITGSLWSWGSVPTSRDTSQFAGVPLFWLTPLDKLRADSVFGKSGDDETDRGTHDYLRVVYQPDSADTASWAGIMTCPSELGMNLRDVEELRVIMRSRRSKGVLHVTAAMSIDEDAPRRDRGGKMVGFDGILNTEDVNGNGMLDSGENRGLDTVARDDSLWREGDSLDDGNDDYDVQRNPMGTEGNPSRRPDGEDLDRSGFTRYNHYYECAIPVNDGALFDTLHGPWRLCRVPLRDTLLFKATGQPKWEEIRFVRIWFDGFEEADTLDFYSIEFSGSRWRDVVAAAIRDTAFARGGRDPNESAFPDTSDQVWVTQISSRTDPGYTPPFELKRDAQGNLEQEAALVMGYRELNGNRRVLAHKTGTEREDYRDYRELRIYVHDDGNALPFVIRLGTDSLNYYQHRALITSGNLVPGRDDKWYEFVLDLDTLPFVKQNLSPAGGGPYQVRGTPSLGDVRYFALGFENERREKVSGAIWFDDLRLTAPRKEAGYGFQTQASLAFSDFASANVRFGYSDPNFRNFNEGRVVKTGGFGTDLRTSLTARVDRLLPRSWGVNLPLTYAFSRRREQPKFDARYPDLRLSRIAGDSQVGTGQSEDVGVDDVRKTRSENPWLNYTLEGFAFSWHRRRGATSTVLSRDSSASSVIQGSYSISPDLKVNLRGDNDLSLLPQSVRVSVTDGQRRGFRASKYLPTDSAWQEDRDSTHGLSTDFSADYSPLEDLSFEYGAQTERDMLVRDPAEGIKFLRSSSEYSRDHNFGASYNMEIGDFLTPSVDYSGDYSDDRPKSAVVNSYVPYRNMNNSGEIEFTCGIDLPELLGKLEPPTKTASRLQGRQPIQRADRAKGLRIGDSLGEATEDAAGVVDTLAPVRPPERNQDTTARGGKPEEVQRHRNDTTPRIDALTSLRKGISSLSRVLEALDFSYSTSRASDLLGVRAQSSWLYRLGMVDSFPFGEGDSMRPASDARERQQSMRISTGAKVKNVAVRANYDWSVGKNISAILRTTALDRSTTFPSLDVTVSRIHTLFPLLATDSKLSGSYSRRRDVSGEYLKGSSGRDSVLGWNGRSQTDAQDFRPLVSWQTTWKKRVSTTFSADLSRSSAVSYRNSEGRDYSTTSSLVRGANLSLSYAFSAPQGLRLPFLRRLRFSSDLSLSWSLRLSSTERKLDGTRPEYRKPLQNDNSTGTSVAASYRFSRSIEAGMNVGYTQNRTGTLTNKSTDVNIWVLFKF